MDGDITLIDSKEVTEEVVEMHVETVVEVAGGKIAEILFTDLGSKEMDMVSPILTLLQLLPATTIKGMFFGLKIQFISTTNVRLKF